MDTNELFWATGIDNSGLRANQQEAIQIFTTLANRVTAALDLITQKYGKVIAATKVKFDNPVDPAMISSIKTQIEALGKTIDTEIQKLGNFSAKYDQSISKINNAASKISVGKDSPLAPMVAGIQKDVANSSEQLSFLEKRFKYAFGSMLAYGSISVLKNIASEIIDVKTQFEFLQTAINSFAGSAEKGAVIMKELTQFAVNSPLQVNDITEAAKQLMAFGVGADNVVGQIKMLADVAAGSGKPIKDIAYIYGKSLTEGKVYTRTLMQFGNLGIPIYEALAKVMDTTPAKIKKMTKMGAVGFDDVKRAIESLTSAGGQYYGFSEKMMSTTAGLLSNVKDKWILAMKDMGESSDGFINMSVGLVDTAIAHWKELGDAIVVAATAVGTYQVAKLVSSLGTNLSTAGANIAEANSLATLISAESAANISKQGLVVGSVEYQAAVRAEIALQLQKAEVAVVTSQAEVASLTESKISMDANVISAKANVIEKEKNFTATMSEATATELSTAKKELNTASTNANVVSKEVEVATTNLETATTAKNTLVTNIDTASKEGAVVGTNLLAAAQARLIVMFRTLNATISANPYVFAATALLTLVAVMWALHDSTTAAERAQKNLDVALDAISEKARLKSKMFSDNLDIIKNKALDGTAAQIKAYQVLHDIFGSIIGDKTLDQLKTSDSVDLQNKMNKANEYAGVLQRKKNLDIAQQAFMQQKVVVANMSENGGANISSSTFAAAENNLSELRITYLKSVKAYNDYAKDYNAAKAAADTKEEDDTKEHWKTMIKDADENIGNMGSRAMAALKAGTASQATKDYYKKQLDDKKNAEIELAKFPSDKQGKSAERERERENAEALARKKRLEAIAKDNEQLANMKSQAEINASQAAIDAMDEGFLKQQAIQKNNFEKALLKLKEQKDKMLDIENDIAQKEFLNANPNWKKTGAKAPAIITSLNTEDQKTYNLLSESVQKDADAKSSKLLNDKLIEYNDYSAKKLKIEKDFDADILALENARTLKNSTEIDSAIRQAQVNKAKALMTLSFDQFKSTPEFSLAFEDLGNVSTATLEHLMAELKKYGVTAAGTMKLADFKEYAKTQKAIFDQLLINDPFKALKESVDELKIAEEEMTKAHQDLLDVQNNKPVITGYKPTKGWEGATSIFPSKQVFGEQSSMLPKVGTKNVVPPTAIPILLELGEATTNATVKDNQFTEAQKNVVKSTKAVDEKIGELSKNLSSVGAAIGGTAGEIISSIGDIGSFVTSAITGWETASTAGSAAIQTVEKASVILAVISAVITVATKIVSIFTSASKKRKEEAQAELDSIEAVKKAYLDAYATMIDKKFSNIFGDDVFGKATAQIKLMNQAAGDFKDNVVLLAKGDNRVGTIAYDILGRSKTLDIANFDIVKAKTDLARKSITDSEKTILQSLVDDYEAYQSYLDEIDSYLSSIFGQLGSNIMDSLVTDQDNMTKWADDVTGYISDSFTKMVKDIIYNMDFAETLSKEQKIIKGIMADTSTTDAQKEAAMQAQLILFKAQLVSDGTKAAADWKTYSDAWTASGMGTLGGASTDTSNSTVSAIKGMDQPTADILTAQFSALRIHGANMDVNISKININVSDLLLSLQGQTSILQIAFNDVAEIARNTRDLAGIKSILSDMKTYGLKAL